MSSQSKGRPQQLPAALLAEISIVLLRHGYLIPSAPFLQEALAAATISIAAHRDEQTAAELAAANREVAQAGGPTSAGYDPEADPADGPGKRIHMGTFRETCEQHDCPGCPAPGVEGPTGDGDADLQAAAAAADSTDDAQRRVMRWQQVAEVVAVGLAAPPDEVRISEDGWALTLLVSGDGQVKAWAQALGIGVAELQVRVSAPRKGVVVRETFAERRHPFETRIASVQNVPSSAMPAAVAG